MAYRAPNRPHAAVLVRQDDGSTWSPDAVLSVQFAPGWQISDHPVEQGVSVSDHIRRQPQGITVTCVVTANPTRGTPGPAGALRLRDRLAWLIATADAGRLIDIVTPTLGTYRGYALQSAPHGIDGVSRLEFSLQLREVRVATSTLITISTDTTAEDSATGAPAEVDVGEQPTTNSSGTTTTTGTTGTVTPQSVASSAAEDAAEDDDRSYLAEIVDWLGA